ncbi:hypothetical protein GP486_004659 [Trichoglossum hirsutum]|uniref:SGNH hydrolase-type esterase domain-containing protein n=1 Tax=Trichoglossum hirsutum TaxID=265104 RepID=A0A9P8LAL8_9PEZI|nr:hypothetical protein GP486_004659 [Trichoglossum hirsutum]
MAIKAGFSAFCFAALLLVSPNFVRATPTAKIVPRAISKYYALGDSYGSGLAAGKPWSGDPNVTCGRFDKAFGVQLKDNAKVKATTFGFLACSGSRAQDVQNNQTNFDTDADMVTVSMGGNNVGWGDVVNGCVYRFNGPLAPDCDKALQNTTNLINDVNSLYNPVFNGIYKILQRVGTRPNFRLYVVGYVKFWNANTDQCDNVSWNYWQIPGTNPQKMTKALRKQMNDLLEAANSKISSVVDAFNNNHENRVIFVNPDSAYEGHRFCENGVTEPMPPNTDRPDTWLFQVNTPVGSVGADEGTLQPTGYALQYYQALLTGTGVGSPGQGMNAPTINPVYAGKTSSSPSGGVPLWISKIFHPTTPGHAAIANAIASRIS